MVFKLRHFFFSFLITKLRRSLYGLKQPPRAWFEKFRTTLVQAGFQQSKYDPLFFLFLFGKCKYDPSLSLYYKSRGITFYFMLMISSLWEMILIICSNFRNLFMPLFIWRIWVPSTLVLKFTKWKVDYSINTSILGILLINLGYKTQLWWIRPEINVKYIKDKGTPLSYPTTYRKLVGSLIYLTITRPHISHAINLVSQFRTHPTHAFHSR